ncbi:MAG TPA: hypothetical protein VIH57_07875 [Bacteroidales bacterium]
MTVISAVISTHCIAVSSDSLLTVYNSSTKTSEIIETRKPKIIRIEKFLGAFSYWGLAAKSKSSKWTTYEWLRNISNHAQYFDKLEDFAKYVRDELEKEIKSFRIEKKYTGIGIHLTGYEDYDGLRIPELFLISNYTDETYSKIGDLAISRHLFHTMPEEFKAGHENLNQFEKQLLVKDFLTKGRLFIFNNGDPDMFNPFSSGYRDAMDTAKKRNVLKDPKDIEIYRSIARRPIEMVTKAQKDFYKKGKIIVGGRVHDLVIEKLTGQFTSTSGV